MTTLLLFMVIASNAQQKREYIIQRTQTDNLRNKAQAYTEKYLSNKTAALKLAAEKGWIIREEFEDGRTIELQGVTQKGLPLYYITNNANAASTTSTNQVWTGGSSGLNLDGTGMIIGIWDAGAVLGSHQELTGRMTQRDDATTTHYHATHVAGTLIGSGVENSARGMAWNADLDARDWDNDEGEMATAAADGLLISNHSYGFITGWYWDSDLEEWEYYGDTDISSTEDYCFGFYSVWTRDWDEIAFDAPFYLIVKSAGNDRNDGPGITSGTDERDGDENGYDCIPEKGIAKNILTVGAVADLVGGYTGDPSSVIMTSFSSWGPADDGRIKPDICGNGVALYSTDDDADDDYATLSGTSMASPNVSGSLLLLQEHYIETQGNPMRASSLKALAIHTADEAGPTEGPDYMFGWGLLNTETAADVITNNGQLSLIEELTVTEGNSFTLDVEALGTEPLVVTIVWTDPPGTPVAPAVDPADIMLVNDLDLRVSDGTVTYFPYCLNGQQPENAATKGDNDVDNVEKVFIAGPDAGSYTITVHHEGSLTNGEQNFSLIVSGIGLLTCPGTPTVTDYNGNIYGTVQIGNQCWLRENLKNTHYADGTPLIDGTSVIDITGDYLSKYCFSYNNNINNVSTYGRLYTWAAVMNEEPTSNYNPSSVQGICPSGWHLPSDAEWIELTGYLGEFDNSGGKLKESGTAHWLDPNTDATNESGFTALPGGVRFNTGTYQDMNYSGIWWSSTESDEMSANTRGLLYNSGNYVTSFNSNQKDYGFSVRCVKDFQNSFNDSIVLVTLYNSVNGNNWITKDNWLTGPLHTWHGITISGGRVIDINLTSNNLIGSIPSEIGNLDRLRFLNLDNNQLNGSIPPEIGNLSNLQVLDLTNNQITGNIPENIKSAVNLTTLTIRNNEFENLPVLNTLTALISLDISSNKFTFEDIEPNIGIPLGTFLYSPQANIGIEQNIILNVGDTYEVSAECGGSSNQYQWYKDGNPLSGEVDDMLILSDINFDDDGTYMCQISNTVATDLTLFTHPCIIEVLGSGLPDPPVIENIEIENDIDLVFTLENIPGTVTYNTYRGTSAFFTPDKAGGSNRIATNVSDEDPVAPGVQWTDVGAIGDAATNYFYIFTKVDGDESENSTTIGEFDFNLITTPTTDFNEIAIPLNIQGVTSAADLMLAIPGCNSVARWDAGMQGYEQYIDFIPATNFDVTAGNPYYVNVTGNAVFTLVGEIVNPSFNLITTPTTDFNEVMLTLDKTSIITASQLMSDISSCNSVARWSSDIQGYEQYISFIPETNFGVRVGYPYYVNVTSNVTWPASGGGSLKSLSSESFELIKRRSTPHLVYGTIDISNSELTFEDLDFSAYFPSTPEEILDKNSAGCMLIDGYSVIQCNSFSSGWGIEEPLKIEFKDQNGLVLQSTEVQLTYNPADKAMDVILGGERSFTLSQNVPNPFSDETIIEYQIPEKGKVILEVYSLTGQKIRTLVNDYKQSGSHEVTWNRTDTNNKRVPDAMYIYILKNKNNVVYKKATVIR